MTYPIGKDGGKPVSINDGKLPMHGQWKGIVTCYLAVAAPISIIQ
jgi:hypothetical protein